MASWFGYSAISFHHAPSTITVPLKEPINNESGKETTDTTLSELCASVTPSCLLNPLMFNGHMHTLRAAINRAHVPVHYRRHVFTSDSAYYPGQFAVDFVARSPAAADEPTVLPRTTVFKEEDWKTMEAGSNDSKPMLIVLHGISGGSHELYLRYVIHNLMEEVAVSVAPKSKEDDELWVDVQSGGSTSAPISPAELNPNGWEAAVINARGCAKSEITSPRLFNARATWDLRQLVKWLRRSYPNRPLFALGFSLGGNILVNYLGEEGTSCQFRAAVVCSNPWNLEVGSLNLQRTWIGLNVYSKTLGANMKKLFERNIEQISKDANIDVEKVRATKYLHDFDRELQGPTWGYPTEGAYYRDASSTEPVMAVRIPLFAIHADDDPIAPLEALPMEEVKRNPFVVMCNTSMGGHLGWFELGGGRWFVKPIVNFLRKMAEDVDFNTLRTQTRADSDTMSKAVAKVRRPVFNSMRRKLDVQS